MIRSIHWLLNLGKSETKLLQKAVAALSQELSRSEEKIDSLLTEKIELLDENAELKRENIRLKIKLGVHYD